MAFSVSAMYLSSLEHRESLTSLEHHESKILTHSETLLPARKRLEIIIMKCRNGSQYHLISEKEIIDLIIEIGLENGRCASQNYPDEHDEINGNSEENGNSDENGSSEENESSEENGHERDDKTELEGFVICCHLVSPRKFYLQWLNDAELLDLLKKWLYETQAREDLEMEISDVKAGVMASVYSESEQAFFRARVLDTVSSGMYKVHLIDIGKIQHARIEHFRFLPRALGFKRPLCFQAYLQDVEPNRNGTYDLRTNQQFETFVTQKSQPLFVRAGTEIDGTRGVRILKENESVSINTILNMNLNKPIRYDATIDVEAYPSEDESHLLAYANEEIDVKRIQKFRFKDLLHVRVTHVISPSDFYIELLTERLQPSSLFHLMNKFYNNPQNKEILRVNTNRVFLYRCYAYYSPERRRWERVRVVSIDPENDRARVYLLDVGDFALIPFEEFMELVPEFSCYKAIACRAFLADCIPTNDEPEYNSDAIQVFKGMVDPRRGKCFWAIVRSTEMVETMDAFEQEELKLGLILAARNPKREITVAGELFKAQYALCTGIACGHPALLEELCSLPSEFSTYNDGINKTVEDQIVRLMTSLRLNQFNTTGFMPSEIRNCLGGVNIVFAMSPGCFYVQMKGRLKQVIAVSTALSTTFSNLEKLSFENVVDGMKLAILLDKNLFAYEAGFECFVYRAVVKQVIHSVSLIRVVLVDFGVETSVKLGKVRALPPIFCEIPAFAYRCHLDKPGIVPAGAAPTWNPNSANLFRKYVLTWNQEAPLYYGYIHHKSYVIELEEFSQEVQYNATLNQWVPAPLREIDADKVINSMKNDILLHNHFISCGLSIDYEKTSGPDEVYQIIGVEDVLIATNHAVVRE